ncbi:ornithine racemase [Granulicatella balaenopterae]|uniref:Ornithine racemase n=1 Tax=Granulicatella balaenopterae TaxID=137733 RepID=A0A1H9NX71_9LACT|nr:alanine racemase [Granulicatella balaenopterae]SER40471.1 ornithine racemase [Granulicatella balaenopterae]
MNKIRFPRIIINKEKLIHNMNTVDFVCRSNNITVSGVIKGVNGNSLVLECFLASNIKHLASSRLNQLRAIKEVSPSTHTLALRVPMLTELEELVEVADCSLNSEIVTLKELQKVSASKNIKHEVLLMVDLGDLREGFFNEEELFKAALFVESDCPNLILKGIGTNLGCYGSIAPDNKNLGRLVSLAQIIESKIKRKLEWVSGGATTSLPLVLKDEMPQGITHLRIGNGIYLRDLERYFDYTFDEMYSDAFELQAQVVEVHEKPSYPIGTISVDAFGNSPEYIDIGMRQRALLGMGRQGIGDMTKLLPLDSDIQVIGGSSDHTILDITDAKEVIKVGDIVTFNIQYENLLYGFSSEYVEKVMI